MCYGSTTYRSYQVGVTWELGAFCGRSTCLKNATGFFEKVEDCGPVPKANENCRAVPGTGPAFPDCCPKYECVRGVNLEYPTEAEIKAAVEEARKAQEEQLRAAQREQQGPDPQAPAQG